MIYYYVDDGLRRDTPQPSWAFSMLKYLEYRPPVLLLNPVVASAVVVAGTAVLLEETLDPMRARYNYVPE